VQENHLLSIRLQNDKAKWLSKRRGKPRRASLVSQPGLLGLTCNASCHLHLHKQVTTQAYARMVAHSSLNCFSLAGTFHFSITKDASVLPYRARAGTLLSTETLIAGGW
jgi:hypothetical protein